MGTRGLYGFMTNNNLKCTYNHYDSYPTGLGASVIDFIKATETPDIINIVNKLKMVTDDDKPTYKELRHLQDLGVYDENHTANDMYEVLRGSQGVLSYLNKGLGYMIDNHKFADDSLFCEWGYIINTDTSTLEIYKGFNKEPNGKGRFCENLVGTPKPPYEGSDYIYYPITLVAEITLDEVRKIGDVGRYLTVLERTIYDKEK